MEEENLNITKNEKKKFSSEFCLENEKSFIFDINTLFLGQDDLFKENINLNKPNEEEKNNESIDCKEEKNFNPVNFSNDCNNGFCPSFFSNSEKYNYKCLNSNKNYINCKKNNYFNKVSKNNNRNLSNTQVISGKCSKNEKIFCKCPKSGCKYKYCECFKAQQECTDLCKCFNCKNPKNPKINYYNKFNEICPSNSLYIRNNMLFEEENQENSINNFLSKKRKNIKYKYDEVNKEENINIEDDLFDEKGRLIFKHSILSQFKRYQKM